MSSAYDLLIIGGGSAGLTAARTAGRFGARTLLVERDRLGGDCLWTGCVPSKALLHAAAEVRTARSGARYGLDAPTGSADLAAVMRHVKEAIAAIEPHDSVAALRPLGVEAAYGAAVFTGPRTLAVGEREVSFRYAVVATGSSPALVPVPGLAEAAPLTSDTVWELSTLPERLVVLGGGPIGCELGQAFVRLRQGDPRRGRGPAPAARGAARRAGGAGGAGSGGRHRPDRIPGGKGGRRRGARPRRPPAVRRGVIGGLLGLRRRMRR